MRCILFLVAIVIVSSCKSKNTSSYSSDHLIIDNLSTHCYVHTSYLETESYGKVACNGMIVVSNGEAVIVDTPINDADATALIEWIENNLNAKVTGVVATHFHEDCLGSLQTFHDRGIATYATNQTIELATKAGFDVPKIGFKDTLNLKVGSLIIENKFLGAGHTQDNIVTYVKDDSVLFGGCLVKSLNAAKGYLGDAVVNEWPQTITQVKMKYPNVKIVIPGHGAVGDSSLLDYTHDLFKNN